MQAAINIFDFSHFLLALDLLFMDKDGVQC